VTLRDGRYIHTHTYIRSSVTIPIYIYRYIHALHSMKCDNLLMDDLRKIEFVTQLIVHLILMI